MLFIIEKVSQELAQLPREGAAHSEPGSLSSVNQDVCGERERDRERQRETERKRERDQEGTSPSLLRTVGGLA